MCPITDRNPTTPQRQVQCAATWSVLMLALIPGCNEQDMVVQPKLKPYQESAFFVDGQSARPLVPGTIARGQLNVDPAYETGKTGDLLVDKIPARVKVDKMLLARGQERYNIYCSPCHSRSGDGHGMIVQRGFPSPPSFHDQRLLDAPAGHFFNVMTNGYGAMYAYASRLPVADRWAIVAYMRALQLSQHATLDDVPEKESPRLKANEKESAK